MLPDLLEGTPLSGVDIEAGLAASAQVRAACGWHIAPQIVQEVEFTWSDSGRYLLPSLYVAAVNSVKINGTAVTFDWSRSGAIHVLAGVRNMPSVNGPRLWGYGLRSVLVNFTHGFESCPADVRQAVAVRANRLSAGRVQTQSAGPFSSTTSFDSDPDADLLSYRLPSIG